MKQILELVHRAWRVCGGTQAKWGELEGCRAQRQGRGAYTDAAEEGGVSEGLTKAGLVLTKEKMDFNGCVLPVLQRKASFIKL